MKPFDLQKACDNHPLVTRDGREVTEFCYFKNINDKRPVKAVIRGCIFSFTEKGIHFLDADSPESEFDLFLKSEKKKLYISIHKKSFSTTKAYESLEQLEKERFQYGDDWQIVEVEVDV